MKRELATPSNLLSIARSNRVFLPHLIDAGKGHVVNTASASGLLAYGFDEVVGKLFAGDIYRFLVGH